ncbi:thrombopoietin receptor [Carettochelys insculpta]|uniref:thrombopoietin receptor n=1 Tax=Carettochelys insculpta TaxID=44489 RepID=UPI003EB7259B
MARASSNPFMPVAQQSHPRVQPPAQPGTGLQLHGDRAVPILHSLEDVWCSLHPDEDTVFTSVRVAEKKRVAKKQIFCLLAEDGNPLTDPVEMHQTYAIPGHTIFDNFYLVQDFLELGCRDGPAFSILSWDQEKAFKRVDHGHFLGTLWAFGFGPSLWIFIRCCMQPQSLFKFSWTLTVPVSFKQGEHQHCLLSAQVCTLAIERFLLLLCRWLTERVLCESEIWLALSAYASDLVLMVHDPGNITWKIVHAAVSTGVYLHLSTCRDSQALTLGAVGLPHAALVTAAGNSLPGVSGCWPSAVGEAGLPFLPLSPPVWLLWQLIDLQLLGWLLGAAGSWYRTHVSGCSNFPSDEASAWQLDSWDITLLDSHWPRLHHGVLSPGISPLSSSCLHADVALLAEVSETIRCFSRSFEDLTCFWDEEEAEPRNHTYRFYYTYDREKAKECALVTQRRSGGGRRYVCIFPSSLEVRLFTQLCVHVLDTPSNHTKYSRKVAVETVGLISPPVNIRSTWTGAAGELQVSWEPPDTEYEFFVYELLYCTVDSNDTPVQKQVGSTRVYVLDTLKPGVKYHIRIRTKPDGKSLDGFWGPWSEAVAAETPHSSEEIGLRCFTPDLQWMRCEWTWDPSNSNSSHSLFYRFQGSSDSSRGQAWWYCQEHSAGPQSCHACTFQPSSESDIFILVNVSRVHPESVLSYFGGPFQMHQTVLTGPPRILQANITGGQLRLQWAPPQEGLAEYLVYQIRFSVENSLDWKVLQIQHGSNSETIDLRAGSRYLFQVRTKPNGQQLQGFWSAWSETLLVEAPQAGMGDKDPGEPEAFPVPGWIILSLTITLLFFMALLGLMCAFPSMYSSVKGKLWPPAPDLHRVLGTFLTDSGKQQQANASFYNKPFEDVIRPCLLEVLSERKEAEMPPEPTPLKTACPESSISEGPEEAEASNLSSPHQDYMVLHTSSPTDSHYENEYLDSREERDDTYLRGLAVLLLHIPDAHSELQQERAEYSSLVSSSLPAECTPPGGPVGSDEEEWNCSCSQKQSMPTTHISNQSYLLMSSWEQQLFL